jgi:hypothetical protein
MEGGHLSGRAGPPSKEKVEVLECLVPRGPGSRLKPWSNGKESWIATGS